jgi:signal peptidase I
LSTAKLRELWKNEYFKTAAMVISVILIVIGFWYGSQLVLNTQYPALAVASGSMCVPYYMSCDGWSHPFERTLHIGDLIIVQGINPKDIKAAPYPEGDIIVFHRPKSSSSMSDELIVHRAINSVTRDNGLVYFRTRGDGSPSTTGDFWPSDYRGLNYSWTDGTISENLVVGKVVMRIPWIGHLALFMRNSVGIYIIIALIVIIVVIEFVLPMVKRKEDETKTAGPAENTGNKPETSET